MPQPKNAKNDEYTILERRKLVANLYLQGKTQWDIAHSLGIGQSLVSYDLAAVRAEWLASAVRDFDAKKAEELAKIDRLEEVAYEAWERSCRNAESKRRRQEEREVKSKDAEGKDESKLVPIKVVEDSTSKGQSGDPRFLERIAWCIETRLKLTGLLKQENTTNVNVAVLPPDFWNNLYHRKPLQVNGNGHA